MTHFVFLLLTVVVLHLVVLLLVVMVLGVQVCLIQNDVCVICQDGRIERTAVVRPGTDLDAVGSSPVCCTTEYKRSC